MTYKRKLIEVALPLEAINKEAVREKSIRHGHPSTLHLWWARRPLVACRAVLFASLVDDPSAHPERFTTAEDQESERWRLFQIIEALVKWENSANADVLAAARAEIMASTNNNPPPVLDPFCGGGSIPLEAQRLGLEVHASDLNPVAVLITKALIEIAPKFANRPPVNPEVSGKLNVGTWKGSRGMAEDLRYYGGWIRNEAMRRIGSLYPKVTLPPEHGGGQATVIAWLWSRTVKCPNPACAAEMPLVRSFELSRKKGKRIWVQPLVDRQAKQVEFEIHSGRGEPVEGTVTRRGVRCLVCENSISLDHVRAEGQAGRMGRQLLAIVAEGPRTRLYVRPDISHVRIADSARPMDPPDTQIPFNPRYLTTPKYGLVRHSDLFTPRQLVALTTLSDLVSEVRDYILKDAVAAGLDEDGVPLVEDGLGADAYADAVATYLGLAVSRTANTLCTLARWTASREQTVTVFARQALPMSWDYPDVNPFAGAAGDLSVSVGSVAEALEGLVAGPTGRAKQMDIVAALDEGQKGMVATDPPYYDNIGYADLSDFFYIWLRRSLKDIHPLLFSTLLTPKQQELVADPHRFEGDKNAAERFFEDGLRAGFSRLRRYQDSDYPFTLFYAFKQTETDENLGTSASTGWEVMLEGLMESGFEVTATWPMRSELGNRPRGIESNALASSIVLACRPRPMEASMSTKKEFIDALRTELPDALRRLQQGNIAPVDLAQAAIGPGMAIFSRYSRVIEADGSPMRVRTALELINQTLTEVLSHMEDEFDSSTRWGVGWFEQHGLEEGPYGEADVLARAKGVAVNGLVQDGIVSSARGKVRLLRPDELSTPWDPMTDQRLRAWEITHHLVRALMEEGEEGAAAILRKVGVSYGDLARDLAYRLYNTCERKKWAPEALGYNQLVVAWPEIARLATIEEVPRQPTLE